MKYLSLALTLLVALATFCKAAIIQVTDENFSDLVQKEDEWLLDFYADWCGYCKRLEPKYFAAERLLGKSSYSHVKVGTVNIEKNPGLAARFFVSKLPTIVHIKDHEVRLLKPTQKENDIVGFVTLEEWRSVEPKSSLLSPFSLFGKTVGFAGKMIKKFSTYSPWTLIGVLTGFLIFAVSLPIIFKNKNDDSSSKKSDGENEQPTESKAKQVKASQVRERKSKRID